MKKVVLISGAWGGRKDFLLINYHLKNKFKTSYFKYNTLLTEKIEKISKQLQKFIQKQTSENEKVDILALSAGGIIADYYLKFIDNHKVENFVSVCSPFNGTPIAYLFPKTIFKGISQLRKNTNFLRKLNNKSPKTNQLNIWSKYDILVPGYSGQGPQPHHTYFFLHPIIHFFPPIIKRLKRFLLNNN